MSTFKDIIAQETPAAEKRPEVEQKKSDVSVPCLQKETGAIHPQKPDKNLYLSALERLGLTGGDNAEDSLADKKERLQKHGIASRKPAIQTEKIIRNISLTGKKSIVLSKKKRVFRLLLQISENPEKYQRAIMAK